MAFIAKGGVFKGLPAGCLGSWFASGEGVLEAVHAGNNERKKRKVMGKWGDGSLHGRRMGKVMGEGAGCRR